VTVSRAQFEVEFAALREIWKCAARVRAEIGEINSPFPPENETPEARLARFFRARSEFAEAHNALLRAIDDNSPFYPPEVYAVVDALRLRTGLESTRLNTRRPPFAEERDQRDGIEWYEQRNEAVEEVKAGVEAVSNAIRRRLASIAVIQ
jgi:hypothetical protein